jgi:hypothetical protein
VPAEGGGGGEGIGERKDGSWHTIIIFWEESGGIFFHAILAFISLQPHMMHNFRTERF